ncbi:MAG: B12-binding domain-containing radical SAM protein [Candidatus Methylomirabilis sp.]|nr:B12-binding domain-containing radical SAM protein [Deltaproteobacteria bacterium]
MTRASKKLAFIYPPEVPLKNNPSLDVVNDDMGTFPCLSLLYVAALAERQGHEVSFLDMNAAHLGLEDAVRWVNAEKPDYLLYNMATLSFHEVLGWIRAIKERCDVPTIVGGSHLHLYPAETVSHACIDYACSGDAETMLSPLLDAIDRGRDLREVPGLAFTDRKTGEIVLTTKDEKTSFGDRHPWPARHLIDNTLYHSILSRRKNYTALFTSRGCPYQCTFCDRTRKIIYYRSPKNVVDEMQECVEEYGIHEADVFDAVFSLDRDRTVEICREMIRRKLDLELDVRTRVDHVDPELLDIMRRAGVRAIYYGVESADPEILSRLDKKVTLPLIEKSIRDTQKAGMQVLGFFMFGGPGETEASFWRTVEFAKKMDFDYVQLSKFAPFPDSVLYKEWMARHGWDYWGEYTKDATKLQVLDPLDTDMTEEQLRRLIKKAYTQFYFRPRYLWKVARRTRSLEEIRKGSKTALRMLLEGVKVRDFKPQQALGKS